MSVANVSAVRVTSNTTADCAASVLVGPASYPLSTETIKPSGNVSYDLNTIKGLNSGSVFTGRIAVPATVASANDNTQLTFVSNAKSRAIYSVGGSANAPSITYQGTEAF